MPPENGPAGGPSNGHVEPAWVRLPAQRRQVGESQDVHQVLADRPCRRSRCPGTDNGEVPHVVLSADRFGTLDRPTGFPGAGTWGYEASYAIWYTVAEWDFESA